ncbi:MAG: hypothetical protein CMC14_06710 [Flavobacteriaceae bacterium]|nr:hypothetical protein [Flavobacteriaceae bacterium]|tara:strand:+ start:164070 stop:165851 length:1782 start_codon:yes stop_codon:yes gene_type:complete
MRYLLIGFLLFLSCGLFAQNDLLAKNYFEQGEYEKALVLYKRLVQQNKGNTRYLVDLVKTHQQLEQYSEAEELLKEYTEGKRIIPQFLIELGYNYALQNKDSIAQINYQKAIEFVKESPPYAYIVGQVFSDYNLLDEAVTVYETAMMQDDSRNYYAQLARIYGEQGELEKMFETYVELIKINPTYNGTIKRNFSLYITEDPTNEANILLRKTLLKKLQQDPDVLYNELLSWLFIQQKDFKKAFIQEKAIYARREENLSGLLDLGKITIDEKSYEDAKEIIHFIIEKAYNPRLKLEGYQQLMYVELELAQEKDYPKIDAQYKQLLSEFGDDRDTYLLQIDYNDFLAFRYGKKEEAIQNLKALSKKGLTIYQEARVKLKLADILVYDEKFNEALIYYSQVQNKVQNDVLAQEARFKVARTSYFKGDFEWAQVQLDVLKKSASQLIANDAMQLSLMIQDNSLEDSTQTALKKFATADLRALQNKNVEAITLLKDILTNHKGEEIEDEALLKMGMIYEKLNQFENAEAQYLKLIELYKEDILADDAHFKLAKLYETYLGQPEKAKELYEQIIFNFQDSIYFVEARKRYRMLRGDEIN